MAEVRRDGIMLMARTTWRVAALGSSRQLHLGRRWPTTCPHGSLLGLLHDASDLLSNPRSSWHPASSWSVPCCSESRIVHCKGGLRWARASAGAGEQAAVTCCQSTCCAYRAVLAVRPSAAVGGRVGDVLHHAPRHARPGLPGWLQAGCRWFRPQECVGAVLPLGEPAPPRRPALRKLCRRESGIVGRWAPLGANHDNYTVYMLVPAGCCRLLPGPHRRGANVKCGWGGDRFLFSNYHTYFACRAALLITLNGRPVPAAGPWRWGGGGRCRGPPLVRPRPHSCPASRRASATRANPSSLCVSRA